MVKDHRHSYYERDQQASDANKKKKDKNKQLEKRTSEDPSHQRFEVMLYISLNE